MHERCVLCLQTEPLTLEHVIPEALGGRLTSRFLCKGCNSRLGHALEGKAKTDPTVRLLAQQLKPLIPTLATTLERGQRYLVKGPGPSSVGYIKDGVLRVQASKLADSSLIQDTPEASTSIASMLSRDGASPVEIAAALRLFASAPENTLISISKNIDVIKWSVEHVELSLDGDLMNSLVPAKSAYEFLALHVGSAIYEESPPLKAIRQALRTTKLNEEHIRVERLHAIDAKPFHGLVFEGNAPHARVQVRLFGKLALRVHFPRLSIGGSRGMYTHDLESNEEHVRQLPQDDA